MLEETIFYTLSLDLDLPLSLTLTLNDKISLDRSMVGAIQEKNKLLSKMDNNVHGFNSEWCFWIEQRSSIYAFAWEKRSLIYVDHSIIIINGL